MLKDLKENMLYIIKKCVNLIVESQGTTSSDLVSEIISLESKAEDMGKEQTMLKDRIRDLENCREKNNVKSSRKEMTEKVPSWPSSLRLWTSTMTRRLAIGRNYVMSLRKR